MTAQTVGTSFNAVCYVCTSCDVVLGATLDPKAAVVAEVLVNVPDATYSLIPASTFNNFASARTLMARSKQIKNIGHLYCRSGDRRPSVSGVAPEPISLWATSSGSPTESARSIGSSRNRKLRTMPHALPIFPRVISLFSFSPGCQAKFGWMTATLAARKGGKHIGVGWRPRGSPAESSSRKPKQSSKAHQRSESSG